MYFPTFMAMMRKATNESVMGGIVPSHQYLALPVLKIER